MFGAKVQAARIFPEGFGRPDDERQDETNDDTLTRFHRVSINRRLRARDPAPWRVVIGHGESPSRQLENVSPSVISGLFSMHHEYTKDIYVGVLFWMSDVAGTGWIRVIGCVRAPRVRARSWPSRGGRVR